MVPSSSNDGNNNVELSHLLALWSFFEERAGAQKDRMIAIASSLFAINAALLGFAFSGFVGVKPPCPPGIQLWQVAAFVGTAIALVAGAVVVDFCIHFDKNVKRANKLREDYKSLGQLIEPLMPLSRRPPFFRWIFGFTILLLLAPAMLLFAGKFACS